MRAQLITVLALAASLTACGGSKTPTSPTPTPAPIARTWSLTGAVRSSAGGAINAAIVSVLDGPDSGKQATADIGGRYSFSGLQQAGFSVRATASGYTPVTEGVTLTGDRVLDFQLPRLPVAALTFEGNIDFRLRPDGGYDMTGTAVNSSGDGCASAISGSTTLTGSSGATFTFPWSLAPATIIRPGERFQYRFGPLTRNDANQLGTGNGSYTTTFDFISGACQ